MNRTLPLALAFLLVSTAVTFSAEAPQTNDTVALKYIEATTAYETVRSAYPEISSVVTGIQVKKNSIALDLSDPRAAEVRRRLEAIDQRPKMVLLSATVVETDKAHANTTEFLVGKILSRRTLFTLEGKPAVISQQMDNGKYLKIIVQGRSVGGTAEK